jgi:hypothetical protein
MARFHIDLLIWRQGWLFEVFAVPFCLVEEDGLATAWASNWRDHYVCVGYPKAWVAGQAADCVWLLLKLTDFFLGRHARSPWALRTQAHSSTRAS